MVQPLKHHELKPLRDYLIFILINILPGFGENWKQPRGNLTPLVFPRLSDCWTMKCKHLSQTTLCMYTHRIPTLYSIWICTHRVWGYLTYNSVYGHIGYPPYKSVYVHIAGTHAPYIRIYICTHRAPTLYIYNTHVNISLVPTFSTVVPQSDTEFLFKRKLIAA